MNLIMNYSTFTTSDYILNILTILGSSLSITDSFMDYSIKELRHKFYASKMMELINDIESTLAQPPKSRQDGPAFLRNITMRFVHLANGGSPSFVTGAERRLSRQIENDNLGKSFEKPGLIHRLHNHLVPNETAAVSEMSPSAVSADAMNPETVGVFTVSN